MRKRFLMNYTNKNLLNAFRIFYSDKYDIEGNRRAKRKIHSIQYRLKLYNSKRYKDKPKYWNEAMECYEQLLSAIGTKIN